MKSFKFDQLDKKLNKKSQKQLAQQKMRQNFLRLYDDIPPDPKMQKYCEQTRQLFDQHCKNNRYYSYQLPEKEQPKSTAIASSVRQIKKLGNFKMPFKPAPQKQAQQTPQARQIRKKKEREYKKMLYMKFRVNIRLIIQKMKRMKITIQDIIGKGLFSKEAYRFGSEIFAAVKQGNPEKVWSILMQKRFSMFSIDNTQKTPLMWSCIRNQPRITKILYEFGADVNRQDLNNSTALDYAIKYNSPECVKILMLALANTQEQHEEMIKKAEERVRNVFNLGLSLMRVLKKIQYGKRQDLFDEQYRVQYR